MAVKIWTITPNFPPLSIIAFVQNVQAIPVWAI